MSTATTTSHDTGQQVAPRGLQREAQQPVTQQDRSAVQRLRTTMAAVRLALAVGGRQRRTARDLRAVSRTQAVRTRRGRWS